MDYQGNTNKSKELPADKTQEKKIEKAELTAKVISRKKPLGIRIKEVFFGGEIDSAARYIAAEVLLPALRNAVVEATSKGIERVVYGDSGYPRTRASQEYRPRVTYNTPINRSGPRANLPDQASRPARNRHDDTEMIFTSRSDADLVLERLCDVVDQFQVASIADLNEIVGLPTTPVDNKWGWDNVRFAEIRQTRDGFVLNLPPAQPL